jgi:hypothetical protein
MLASEAAKGGAAPGQRHHGTRAVLLARVSRLLDDAAALRPAEVLAIVCEATSAFFSLANVVFFERLAGRSRTVVWSAPFATTPSRMIAREQAWTSAALLLEGCPPAAAEDDAGNIASTSIVNDRLGLSAMLHVESLRRLDADDRALLGSLLERIVGVRKAMEG